MKSVDSLNHVTRELPHGGMVLILDRGAVISPEAEAMLQALHSRSVDGVSEHLDKVAERGAEKFMSTYYVGYNHKSIGDCGDCTIFIEGVSMLAAKAIQDWPLYSGQESSTRYIDFSTQRFADPVGTEESERILERWRSLYLEGLDAVIPHLKERFPRKPDEKEKTYEQAIRARAFDIMRGFLPAGATTNLAWHSNLRQVADKLMLLRHHPLEEVRLVAHAIEDAVLEAFPSSFSKKRYEATEKYNTAWMQRHYYYRGGSYRGVSPGADFAVSRDNVDRRQLMEYSKILSSRPPKTELPKQIAECGELQFRFLLDFGSFRDIQRHRAVTQRMPLLEGDHNFGSWYKSELPEQFLYKALRVLVEQKKDVAELNASFETKQYYIAMGYNVPIRITGDLHALVYLVELRATRFVHPTLRYRAQQIARELSSRFKDHGLVLHLDNGPDRFDVRRGEHDIVEKS